MSIKTGVESLSNLIIQGVPRKLLVTKTSEILSTSGIDAEELINLFKVLPRDLTFPHINVFFDAEESLGTTDVSQLLVESDFVRCGNDEVPPVKLVVTALDRLPEGLHNEKVFKWRLAVCSAGGTTAVAKEVDVDTQVYKLVTSALNDPSFFLFEPVLDAVNSASSSLSRSDTKHLVELIRDVMVPGTGIQGLKTFLSKAGQNFLTSKNIHNVERKARIISLCPFLSGKKIVTLEEIRVALDLHSIDEAENYVVDAAIAKIIDCRVNHTESTVEVHSVASLQFTDVAWKKLAEQVDNTTKVVDAMLKEYQSA